MYGIKLLGEDEIFDKNAKIILGSMLAFLFILFSALSYSGYFENNRRDKVLKQNFYAVIIKKNVDYKNHGDITLKLSDSTTLIWYFPKQKIKVLVGDSLVKKEKSIYILVYRNGLQKAKVDMLNI